MKSSDPDQKIEKNVSNYDTFRIGICKKFKKKKKK